MTQPAQNLYGENDSAVQEETHILSVLVDNEAGVLAKIAGLFSARGYNIQSLTVAEIDEGEHLSRFTIKTSGTPEVITQIQAQLDKLVPVHAVQNLTASGNFVAREMVLVKVVCEGDKRIEALRLAEIFRAKPVDVTLDSFIFELTGEADKLKAFIDLMRPLGLAEVARSGGAGLARGTETIQED